MKNNSNMYKNHINFSALLLVAIAIFASCQQVINVKLNSSSSQVVIQAYVTDQPNIDTVLITRTGDYFVPGNYPKVNGATIIVTDNQGTTDTFVQVDSGKYAASHLTGIPGHTYTLKTIVDGKEYDAVSTMPLAVEIDTVTYNQVGNPPDTNYHVHCVYLDPAGVTNYYMLKAYVNNVIQDSIGDITLNSDKYTNGLPQNTRLRIPNPVTNDSIKVYLMSIDANTFNYFTVIRSITGSSNPVSTATPQNPPSNIIGGALGYFSAYSVRSATIVVP